MKKQHKLLSALLLALVACGSAQAVSLKTLIDNNGSITAGPLNDQTQFDNFWFSNTISNSSFAGYDFQALLNSIDVSALNDGGQDPGHGLNFNTNQLSVTSNGLLEWIDLFIGFHVSRLNEPSFIDDNTLKITDLGGVITLAGDNGFFIREQVGTTPNSVLDIQGNGDLATKKVEFSYLDPSIAIGTPGGLTSVLIDKVKFTPTKDVYVSKNIFVWADLDVGINPVRASLNNFEQRFSAVPEPNLLLLIGIGLMGFTFSVKRRNSLLEK